MKTYHSNGKLLLTGEYVVLDGALALAIPTKYGQSLSIESIEEPNIIWKSLDHKGVIWFESNISYQEIISGFTTLQDDVSNRLLQILKAVNTLNPQFFNDTKGFKVTTKLEFPKQWGLGTSSTLINNIADWTQVDPYKLLALTFGGSGYDIACAQNNHSITYQLKGDSRQINEVEFNPSFKENLYFVYLNKKQDSRAGISQYKASDAQIPEPISKINSITLNLISCEALDQFETLIDEHEQIISKIIKQQPVKDLLFNDFKGSIKSLGAWGGDFILVASKTNPNSYFANKGYQVIIPYSEMAL